MNEFCNEELDKIDKVSRRYQKESEKMKRKKEDYNKFHDYM